MHSDARWSGSRSWRRRGLPSSYARRRSPGAVTARWSDAMLVRVIDVISRTSMRPRGLTGWAQVSALGQPAAASAVLAKGPPLRLLSGEASL